MAASNTGLLEALKTAKVKREKALEPNATADKKVCKYVVVIITVQRNKQADDATLGTFDERREGDSAPAVTGVTLEQPPGKRDLGKGNGMKQYPIPAGTYKGMVRVTTKNGKVDKPYKKRAVQLLDVPGYSDVLIHAGQLPEHTEGCILTSGSTLISPVKDKKGNVTERDGSLAGGSAAKNFEILQFIYKVKDEENDGVFPEIRVIVKDP